MLLLNEKSIDPYDDVVGRCVGKDSLQAIYSSLSWSISWHSHHTPSIHNRDHQRTNNTNGNILLLAISFLFDFRQKIIPMKFWYSEVKTCWRLTMSYSLIQFVKSNRSKTSENDTTRKITVDWSWIFFSPCSRAANICHFHESEEITTIKPLPLRFLFCSSCRSLELCFCYSWQTVSVNMTSSILKMCSLQKSKAPL